MSAVPPARAKRTRKGKVIVTVMLCVVPVRTGGKKTTIGDINKQNAKR